MKKRMHSFFKRVRKAMKRPFLCRRNKGESIVPMFKLADPEASALIPHRSSGFESAFLSSTPDNMSKTSSSLSEDNVDEREGDCSMWANKRPSLHIASDTKQDMWGQDGISSIPEYMYTLRGEVPVSVPSVILNAQGATDASPVGNSTTEKHTNDEKRIGFFTRLWMAYLLLCCIQLPDSVKSLSSNSSSYYTEDSRRERR